MSRAVSSDKTQTLNDGIMTAPTMGIDNTTHMYMTLFKVTCKPGGAGFHVMKLYAYIYQME